MAEATHPLVQGLDADLACAHAAAAPFVARVGCGEDAELTAMACRQRNVGFASSRLHGRAVLFAAHPTSAPGDRNHGRRFPGIHDNAVVRLCVEHCARCGRSAKAWPSQACVGSSIDAGLLVPAVAGRLACTLPARARSAAMGEDRAWLSTEFASGAVGDDQLGRETAVTS